MPPKKTSSPKPSGKSAGIVRKTKSKRVDLKARPKSAKAAEPKFGKAARVAAERGGQKPAPWQEADRPKRRMAQEPSPSIDVFAPNPYGFDTTVTRTLAGTMSDAFRAFNDPQRRAWCHERGFAVRSAIAPRMLRLAFADGSLVGVAIVRQGNARCTVSVEQTKLVDAAAAERARQLWKSSLDRLSMMLDE